MADLIVLASHGLAAPDLAVAIVRGSIGGFFAISGFNKLWHEERHAALVANLTKNHIPCLPLMQWWVPGWEFVAGSTLAVGMLSAVSATILAIICVVAICCEARSKVAKYSPINAGDVVADYLYLPEVLYLILLAVVILAGTGQYSLDWYAFPQLR